MITVLNKDNGTVCTRTGCGSTGCGITGCGIDELELSWGWEPISHLYYDQDADVEVVAFMLLDSINNRTGFYWGREHVCW